MKYAALWAGIELTPIILSIFSHFSLLNWYLKLIPGINCFISRYYSTQKSNKRYSRSTELYLINDLAACTYIRVLYTIHDSFMALSVSASAGDENSLDPRFESGPQPANYFACIGACIGAGCTLYIDKDSRSGQPQVRIPRRLILVLFPVFNCFIFRK